MSGDKEYSGKADIVIGALFLGLAVFALVLTSQLQEPREHVSIRNFPTIVSVGMLLLSSLLIAKGITTIRSQPRGADHAAEDGFVRKPLRERIPTVFILRFIGFVVLGFVYTQVIRPVGYIPATVVLLLAVMGLYGEKKWYRLILIPVVVGFVLFHLFRTLFRVPLPLGGLW